MAWIYWLLGWTQTLIGKGEATSCIGTFQQEITESYQEDKCISIKGYRVIYIYI